MRSFLVKDKKPLWKFKDHPEGVMFRGEIPSGYDLAVSPTPGYVIVDIDMHGKKDGYSTIPNDIMVELSETLFYKTRGNGTHCWIRYTGNKILANKTCNLGYDLRTHKGYVVWYHNKPIEECINDIKNSSERLNEWIESAFAAKTKLKR